MPEQSLCRFGERVAVDCRLEQPAAKRRLQLLDAPGDGGVIDAELAPGLAQALEPREPEECPVMMQAWCGSKVPGTWTISVTFLLPVPSSA